MILELAGHHREEAGPPPSHSSKRRDPPPPHGQETHAREKVARTGRRRPALRSEVFRPTFTERGPCQQGTHASRPRRDSVGGIRGRPSRHPFHLPLTRGHRASRDLHLRFSCHLTDSTSVSLPLLARPRGPIGGMSRLPPWASMDGSTSLDSS
jgi:hypothetical protein